MIKDYFDCDIRDAILNEKEQNGEYSVMAPVDYRARKDVYEKFYTKDQLDYLFSHGLIREYTPTGAFWERPWMKKGDYYEFTDYGKKLRTWYASSLKDYLYYNVLHLYNIRIYWQKFRIACGHRYDWQEYEGVDISEI